MKLNFLLPILLIITLFTACKDDEIEEPVVVNELENLIIAQEFETDNHTIEVYTKSGKFYTGYNDVSLRIKNNADNTYFETFTINWMPMMSMQTMNHSCPKSALTKTIDKKTLYNGFVIHQMTGMGGTGWSIKFMYTINDVDYMVEEDITVLQSTRQNVTTFTGSDDVKYIAAIVGPTTPKIAINDLKVALYKMENMMTFPVVADYTITLDPRMPSMNYHSSTNNTDLTYNTTEKMYHGNLSLTMTGYWVLNLKLLDQNDTVLKGEEVVVGTHNQSSLYLEIEF